jgi:NADH-quinone oxidoreductase subunit I
MVMNGFGILRGIWVAFRHLANTYIDDLFKGRKRYKTEAGIKYRASKNVRGIFTVQYPEEKVILPEEFRFLPIIIYDEAENGERKVRCTSCGICSKVCPPQCIWIVRSVDPETGKPRPSPAEFYIDIDICMNCGLCAEFCPFDAIQMDHDYEVASYNRMRDHIYNLETLLKPASYYAKIRPVKYQREKAIRAAKAKPAA